MGKIEIWKPLSYCSFQNFKDKWVNDVKHVKICAECDRKCHCIKGVKLECKECFKCHKDECHRDAECK